MGVFSQNSPAEKNSRGIEDAPEKYVGAEVVQSWQATYCDITIPLDRGSTPMTPEKGESMRSRTNPIIIRLSDEELADLNEKVSKVRGSREWFIRQCISGAAIREAPSVDLPKLIYEVRRVGTSLNRILIIANAKGLLEVPELRRAMERNRELEVRIVNAYTKD